MINVSSFTINTPERKVAEYLECLHKRAFSQMLNHCQVSYVAKYKGKPVFKFSNLQSYLKNDLYKYMELKKCEIVGRKEVEEVGNPDVMVDIILKLTYISTFGTKKRVTEKRLFRVIKEDNQGNPSTFGTWGVNPSSTLRGYDVKS